MDGYAELQFHFTGQLSRPSDSQDSPSDRSVLGHLLEERVTITREIQTYLQEEIVDELGIFVGVSVEIGFQEGSVLFSGVVTILGALATVAGAIDFVEKMVRLIRRVLRWVLGRRAGGRHVSVHVSTMFPVTAIPAASTKGPAEGQPFSLRTILLAVTLLNAAIFIGGSVYTGISVTSIQEKYEKAESEIERVRQDYDKYRAGLQERLGDIEGQLRATAKETGEAQDHAKQLSKDLTSLDGQVQELRTSIATVRDRGASWVSFRLAFRQANWMLKLYLILIPLYFFAILLLALRVIRG